MTEMTGLNLFDDRASAAGNFPSALRGYDRHAVDEYVLSLEEKLGQARDYIRELESQNADLAAQEPTQPIAPGEGDFEHLGNHATEILRVAQSQARELTDRAHMEAERVREEARRAGDELRAAGRQEAEDTKAMTLADLRELRDNLDRQATQHVELARAEAAKIVQAAEQRANAIIGEAESESAAMVEQARLNAEQTNEAARRTAAESVAEAARKREEMLAALRAEHEKISGDTVRLLDDAKQRHAESTELLAAQVAEANRVRSEAAKEAERIKVLAARETEEQIANARRQAEAMTKRAEKQFLFRKEQLGRETELLNQRKQSILAQLSSLSALATQTAQEFPSVDDLDEFSDGAPTGNQQPDTASQPADESDVQTVATSETVTTSQGPAASQPAEASPDDEPTVETAQFHQEHAATTDSGSGEETEVSTRKLSLPSDTTSTSK
ncbi:hypothetical protein CLV29_1248 [Naumannella halotolerans]|uniref:DivIVA protein n=2 Tax=Naumannella halotolerans TaxID=993414 RepID=A0A4R7J8J3_9ACTN|nr:hypothetical protein CLV29_1248 [Naumannella halotolerans]